MKDGVELVLVTTITSSICEFFSHRENSYTMTLAILVHTRHTHVDRCMKTKDVAYQIMENDLKRAMQEWLCTSKEELTKEAEARTWDDAVGNVCHRLG